MNCSSPWPCGRLRVCALASSDVDRSKMQGADRARGWTYARENMTVSGWSIANPSVSGGNFYAVSRDRGRAEPSERGKLNFARYIVCLPNRSARALSREAPKCKFHTLRAYRTHTTYLSHHSFLLPF